MVLIGFADPARLVQSPENHLMYTNYLLLIWAGIRRQPGLFLLRVFSLAIGLGCGILVLLHVQYVRSFDAHFPNVDNIYRVTAAFNSTPKHRTKMSVIPDPWAPQLLLDYPQIQQLARIRDAMGSFAVGSQQAVESKFHWAEPDILPIFSLEFLSGNSSTALDEPFSVVLSESRAKLLFPEGNSLGHVIVLNKKTDLKVTGVYRDLPDNTHIKLPLLVSASTGNALHGEKFMSKPWWLHFSGARCYVTLPNAEAATAMREGLETFLKKNLPPESQEYARVRKHGVYLEPLAEAYFSQYGNRNHRAQIMWGLTLLASVILVTSCVSFAHLSMVQVRRRAREIGVRKAVGASRIQIVQQFLFESLVYTATALLLALPLLLFALPYYAAMTATDLSWGLLWQFKHFSSIFVFVITTGLLAGLMPALALGRLQPARIVQGLIPGKRGRWLRSSATVIQFGISTALVLLSLAISQQIEHLLHGELGFNKENLIGLETRYNAKLPENFSYAAMLDELRKSRDIETVGQTSWTILTPWRASNFQPDESTSVLSILVDEHYLNALQLRLIAGRNFSQEYSADYVPEGVDDPAFTPAENSVLGVIITRQAVATFGLGSPKAAVGQLLQHQHSTYRIVGVVETFRSGGGLSDVNDSTQILRASRAPQNLLFLRIDEQQTARALSHIDAVWRKHHPGASPAIDIFSQSFKARIQKSTQGLSHAAHIAAAFTLLTSFLGLYALAFYSMQRRVKEVGVRRALGARTRTIVAMLLGDFLKPVAVACLLGWALAAVAIDAYLSRFSSQQQLPLEVYGEVALGAIIVAATTILSICLRAARTTPMNVLRHE